MESVQVRFVAANGVIQLRLEGDVVVEVVASAERGPVSQPDIVVERVVRTRVHILVTEERTNMAKLFRNLRIEGRSVEVERAADQGVADQKPLVQKLNSVSHIDRVGVNNRLVISRSRSRAARGRRNRSGRSRTQRVVADLVVIVGTPDLQSLQPVRP